METDVFARIINILEQDKTLVNYSRYCDIGDITKVTDPRSGTNVHIWQTTPCNSNNNNKQNRTQLIRFIKKIDSKFFYVFNEYIKDLTVSDYFYSQNSYSNNTPMDILFNAKCKNIVRRNNNSYDNYDILQSDFIKKMINIDCKYKLKGSAITAFDIIGKNLAETSSDYSFYTKLDNNLSKIILFGDKGYVLAIIDCYHHIFVSMQILERIYKNDSTVDKTQFKECILKLFKIFNTFCLYMLNTSITNYFCNGLAMPIISNIYRSTDFTVNDKMTLYGIGNFTFTEDKKSNDYIKETVLNVIKRKVSEIINKTTYLDCLNLENIFTQINEMVNIKNTVAIDKAFTDGLSVSRIMGDLGWDYVNSDEKGTTLTGKHLNVYLNPEHIYFKKTVDFKPIHAYLSCNGSCKMKVIKKSMLNEYKRNCSVHVQTLYFNITQGTMIADAKHPNVSTSNANVCMGDLKGKVVFAGKSKSEIVDLVHKCEDLLKMINYTSSYTDDGIRYFDYSSAYSQISMGLNDDGEDRVKNKEEVKIVDAETIDSSRLSNDYDEISENDKSADEDEIEISDGTDINDEDYDELSED